MNVLASICFLSIHPNPSQHFAAYAQVLEQEGIKCEIFTSEEMSGKFKNLNSKVTLLSHVENLPEAVSHHSTVITEIASKKWIELHETLAKEYPSIQRIAYYDNPERLVSKEYGELAALTIEKVHKVAFANACLPELGVLDGNKKPIPLTNTIGIGYYPTQEASDIKTIRNNPEKVSEIKKKLGIKTQNILVYAGGANETYYNDIFPHFVKLLKELPPSQLKDTTIVLQQHPRAKQEGNRDAHLLTESGLPAVISNVSTTEAVAISNVVIYNQTSMAAQFAFGEIPSIIQAGPEIYSDVLTSSGYPSVQSAQQLIHQLNNHPHTGDIKKVELALGMDPQWRQNLLKILSK